MKKFFLLSFLNIVLLLLASCSGYALVRYDGPYEGRIINADTGQPLEGVVVLGVWHKEYITPGGGVNEYYDAEETVTDKNGEFSIRGMGLEILSNVTPMNVLIFKAGHEHFGYGPWEELKKSRYLIQKMKIKWEGNRVIIPLRKLTMEERKKEGTPSRPSIPEGKMKLMTNEINRERVEQGFKPFSIER